MNYKLYKFLTEYDKETFRIETDELKDVTVPFEFVQDAMYYQKMFGTTAVRSMGTLMDVSHLSIHAEQALDEMIEKWDPTWIYWLLDEVGSFTLDASECEPQVDHEYVVQQADDPRWGQFEVIDTTDDKTVWADDDYEACKRWIEDGVPTSESEDE